MLAKSNEEITPDRPGVRRVPGWKMELKDDYCWNLEGDMSGMIGDW